MVNPGGALPHITFVIHDMEGGVASMNHQIIENADFGRHFRVRVILWRSLELAVKPFREPFKNATDTEHFEFSKFDNYSLTLKRFNALLNKWPGLLVTNDGIELEAIRKFGTRSVLFSIVHDFYNFKLAIENADLVDYFICHTEVFSKALLSDPSLNQRVKYLLHGVKVIGRKPGSKEDHNRKLGIVSISRLTAAKGVLSFFDIDELLIRKGIEVEWIVVGSGDAEMELKQQWKDKKNIGFYKPDSHEKVVEIAAAGDIFISPSNFEGYGIALLEAMSCGLVPIIHQLPVGVYSDLPEDTGFSLTRGDTGAFADCIARLDKDRDLLAQMAKKANQLVVDKYDISKTADRYLQCFRTYSLAQIDRKLQPRQTLKLGIADKAFVPNYLTRIVKKFK